MAFDGKPDHDIQTNIVSNINNKPYLSPFYRSCSVLQLLFLPVPWHDELWWCPAVHNYHRFQVNNTGNIGYQRTEFVPQNVDRMHSIYVTNALHICEKKCTAL